jgi:hypothetical protein
MNQERLRTNNCAINLFSEEEEKRRRKERVAVICFSSSSKGMAEA